MTHIANRRERTYRSELRTEQAEETRARILDATVRVVARGEATLSIPAVAREAGVSVPTVYRHFGTKADLLAAVYPHLMRRTGVDHLITPHTVEEFSHMVRTLWQRLDELGDEGRAVMASPAAEEARRANMPGRIEASRRFMAEVARDASAADRARMSRIMLILSSSSAMRAWRDYFGMAVDDAADDVDWALRALIASSTGSGDR
jgi:AcrR family transcriptional regulator